MRLSALKLYIILFLVGYGIFFAAQINDESAPASLIGLLSMFVFKPFLKLLILYTVAKIDFVSVDFEQEVKNNNIAAALTYLAIAIVIATAF